MPSSTSDTRTSQHRVLHHRDDPNKKVTAYLNSFFTESQIKDQRSKEGVWTRKICCGTSRSLYCPICCSLLVPEDCKKPAPVQLPFDLDIILTDRRGSSSGLHAVTLTEPGSVNLVDYEGGDAMPRYNNHADEDAVGRQSFLLYPLEGESCALSDVAPCIAKLVVLDCKWTKSSIKEHPELHKLQKVHLTNPPSESYFWRWHSAGPGMLSTIEAIYTAAVEVATYHQGFECKQSDEESLLSLLWIFGLIRVAAANTARKNGKPMPFSDTDKEERRKRLSYIGTEKHKRDKEKGKILKLEAAKGKQEIL